MDGILSHRSDQGVKRVLSPCVEIGAKRTRFTNEASTHWHLPKAGPGCEEVHRSSSTSSTSSISSAPANDATNSTRSSSRTNPFPALTNVSSVSDSTTSGKLIIDSCFSSDTQTTSDDPSMPLLPCVTQDKLTSLWKIGNGVHGVAHMGMLTLDTGSTIQVVVKTLVSGQPLNREARVLDDLKGAGGTPILNGVTHQKPYALVMSYCHGAVLSKYFKNNIREKCILAYEATSRALSEFHASGYCHRDLHAGNIIIDDSEGVHQAHIIDVGSARKLSGLNQTIEQAGTL
ncbi:Discoidin domain-containing receptor tyrosine kinase B-like [Homarus americanus]|uniref:Discoidin domain-containing receptor tyrosine kinase B-like n=1 Tax=Homarus americanus TaxID=6706 RepID=A0A8J5NEC9_HOMAM|nr:Discoidin domain-containing receptor tyrosine kinase B-like [Homarus americanus]